MSQTPNRFIVFQAYGNDDIVAECRFALLTFLLQHPEGIPGLEMWVYTDKEEALYPLCDHLPLRFRKIDAEDLKTWRGPGDFVHRVKIEVLRDIAKEKDGAICYFDTDVIFQQNILPLFDGIEGGKRYMHVQESRLEDEANPVMMKLRRFLEANNPLIWDDNKRSITGEIAMWNASVIGFKSSDAPLLDKVLLLTDHLHNRYPKHVVEQFAFSLIFQDAGPLHAAAREVLHYWNFKELRLYLASFFAFFGQRSVPELARLSQLIQVSVPLQDKASFYLNRSPLNKLRRMPWKPIIPVWASLEQQMI